MNVKLVQVLQRNYNAVLWRQGRVLLKIVNPNEDVNVDVDVIMNTFRYFYMQNSRKLRLRLRLRLRLDLRPLVKLGPDPYEIHVSRFGQVIKPIKPKGLNWWDNCIRVCFVLSTSIVYI